MLDQPSTSQPAMSVLLAAPSKEQASRQPGMLKGSSTLQWAEFKTGLAFLTLASDLGTTDWIRGKEGYQERCWKIFQNGIWCSEVN